MTVATLDKYRTINYDSKGSPMSVRLNLKDKMMQKFYEILMEDFEDTLIAIERQNEDEISIEEVATDLEAKWLAG